MPTGILYCLVSEIYNDFQNKRLPICHQPVKDAMFGTFIIGILYAKAVYLKQNKKEHSKCVVDLQDKLL